jgi:hypothetical protein
MPRGNSILLEIEDVGELKEEVIESVRKKKNENVCGQ